MNLKQYTPLATWSNRYALHCLRAFIVFIPLSAAAQFEVKQLCSNGNSTNFSDGKLTRFYSSMQAFSNDKPRCLLHLPLLSQADVAKATLTHHPQTNDIIVTIEFSESGTLILKQFSTDHIGQSIALLVDGKILALPTLQAPIIDGVMQIQGLWYEDAVRLARSINQN